VPEALLEDVVHVLRLGHLILYYVGGLVH
jgi:hypothetical protein